MRRCVPSTTFGHFDADLIDSEMRSRLLSLWSPSRFHIKQEHPNLSPATHPSDFAHHLSRRWTRGPHCLCAGALIVNTKLESISTSSSISLYARDIHFTCHMPVSLLPLKSTSFQFKYAKLDRETLTVRTESLWSYAWIWRGWCMLYRMRNVPRDQTPVACPTAPPKRHTLAYCHRRDCTVSLDSLDMPPYVLMQWACTASLDEWQCYQLVAHVLDWRERVQTPNEAAASLQTVNLLL